MSASGHPAGHEGVAAGDTMLWRILAVFLALHAALWLLVPDTHARMLVGDRANARLEFLQLFMAVPDLDARLALIFRIGSPGDWIGFIPAFALGGQAAILLQSLLLYAGALVLLYRLAALLAPPPVPAIATLAWVLLPATLFHPHALVSETLCNPMLIALLYVLVRMRLREGPAPADLVLAGALTAGLAFTRHIYLLAPLAVAAWLVGFRPRAVAPGWRPVAGYLALSYCLVALWAGALAVGSGRYPPGDSIGGLGHNLFLRAERMAAMGSVAMPAGFVARSQAAGTPQRTLWAGEFAGYALSHPLLYVRSAASDAANMLVNPGVAMLAGRYMGLFDLGERHYRELNKWREAREREGYLGLARLLWQTSPLGLVLNAAGGALWLAFLAAAAAGVWLLARDPRQPPAIKVLLLGAILYLGVLTSLTAGYTRWDHRSPMEPVLAILFAVAIDQVRRRKVPARFGST